MLTWSLAPWAPKLLNWREPTRHSCGGRAGEGRWARGRGGVSGRRWLLVKQDGVVEQPLHTCSTLKAVAQRAKVPAHTRQKPQWGGESSRLAGRRAAAAACGSMRRQAVAAVRPSRTKVVLLCNVVADEVAAGCCASSRRQLVAGARDSSSSLESITAGKFRRNFHCSMHLRSVNSVVA